MCPGVSGNRILYELNNSIAMEQCNSSIMVGKETE